MEIKLKKAGESDWHKVLEFEWTRRDEKFHVTIRNEDAIKEYIEKSEVFFIYVDDVRAGIISYKPQSTRKIYLDDLLIHPDYTNKDIGKRALDLMQEKFFMFKEFETVVHPKDSKAIQAYLSAGFEIEEWKENCFGNKPGLILRKKA